MRATYRSWTTYAWALIINAVFVAFASDAVADSALQWSDVELARFAEIIAVGTVADVHAEADTQVDAVYTFVSLDTSQILKGDATDRRVTIKQLGGSADGRTLGVPGQALFRTGEQVLVFLERRPRDRSLYTVGMWQGKWRLASDSVSGALLAIRERVDGTVWGAFGPARDVRILGPFIDGLSSRSDSNAGRRTIDWMVSNDSIAGAAAAATLVLPMARRGVDSELRTRRVQFESDQSQVSTHWKASVANAASTWSAAQSTVRLVNDGATTSRCAIGFERSDSTSVGLASSCGELASTGSVLALSGAYVESDTRSAKVPTTPLHAFIVWNDAAHQSVARRCIDLIAAHEVGHVLGLHDRGEAGDSMASLLPTSCNSPGRILQQVARRLVSAADLAQLSPPAADALMVPSAPQDLAAAVSGSTVMLTWKAPVSGIPTAYVVEAGSLPGRADLANVSTDSLAPLLTTTDVGAGVYFVRVRAANAIGVSPASNEVGVTVTGQGPGVPGPPAALTPTVNGSTLVLTWEPPSSGGRPATYVVEAGSSLGASDLARVSTWSAASMFTATGLRAGSYHIRVRATNMAGAGPGSNDIVVRVGGETADLPTAAMTASGSNRGAIFAAPVPGAGAWLSQDVGSVAAAGSTTVSGGTITIRGSGADIWSTADAFRYVYQPLDGDGQITARVASVQHTNQWAKAGVMIREDLSEGSRYVALLVSASNGLAFQRRTEADGPSIYTGVGGAAPKWVKLVRSGSVFNAYHSSDRASWVLIGSDTIPLTESVSAGLAVTSHSDGVLTTATFNAVTIAPATAPNRPPPTVSLTAPTSGTSFLAPATITLSATASASIGTISRVDFYAGSTLDRDDHVPPVRAHLEQRGAGQVRPLGGSRPITAGRARRRPS